MKILQINTFGNLSTGKIAADLSRTLRDNGHDSLVAFTRNAIAKDIHHIQFGSIWSVYADGIMTRFTDKAGFYSKLPTRKLIERIIDYNPDIIHLHNLHGYYINIELLFNFLREYNKPVIWTLHDCWSFTGHCCNFEFIGCMKWKTGCQNCEQRNRYPASLYKDNCVWNFRTKRNLFTSIGKMVLVSPSQWMKNLAMQSYMGKYPIEVIRNGVDLDTFKPVHGDWVKRNNLIGKKIVLGVAGTWDSRKGLADIIKLSNILPDDYKTVVVGLTKKQKKQIPGNILGIERTYDSRELAEVYSAAHIFVNPTYEDNFPSVNLEALACGAPVLMYRTGGGPEIITDQIGAVIPQGDIEAMKSKILSMKTAKYNCNKITRNFDRSRCYKEYLKLYQKVLSD